MMKRRKKKKSFTSSHKSIFPPEHIHICLTFTNIWVGCFYIVNILISKTFAEPKRWSHILLFPSAQKKLSKKKLSPNGTLFLFLCFSAQLTMYQNNLHINWMRLCLTNSIVDFRIPLHSILFSLAISNQTQ